MTVSVIIPTMLRSPTTGRCLQSVAASAARLHPDAEVVLVVNGAGATPPPRTGAANVRVLRSAATGVSQARNDGVAAARHDTILFTDDDLVVPPDWCAAMAAPLRGPAGAWAVAAPVRMAVTGPVTAFFEHERAFDAPPATGSTARTLVTANAGYRRDRLPGAPFDTGRYPAFGEDTDLGLRITVSGGTIRWLGDAPAPVHEVEEQVGSLIRRALKQGTGCTGVYHQRQLLDYYLPAPDTVLARIAAGKPLSLRRFAEVESTPARMVFATLNLIRQVAIMAGYLAGLGAIYEVAFIEVDQAALISGLTAVLADLLAAAGPALRHDWDAVPVRFSWPRSGPAAGAGASESAVPVATLTAVADVVRRAACLVPGTTMPAGAADADLAWLAWDAKARDRYALTLRRLPPGELAVADMERLARAAGLGFARACMAWETYAPPGQIRRWPGAPAPAVAN